jgi:hypothetical protein
MRFGDKSTWSSPYEALASPGEAISHPRLGVFAETLRDRFESFPTLKFIPSSTIWKFSASPLNSEQPGKRRS